MPAVRLVVTLTAAPGRAADLAEAMLPGLANVQQEPGCLQYELFMSVERPDTLVLLEHWADEATLEAHTAGMRSRPSLIPAELRAGRPTLERYLIAE